MAKGDAELQFEEEVRGLSREEAVLRGRRADEIRSDPVFQEAVRELRDRLYGDWEKSKPEERELREDVYQRLWALRSLLKNLHSYMTSGTLITQQAKEEEERVG